MISLIGGFPFLPGPCSPRFHCILSNFIFLPSRDPLDDQFQRILDVLTGITMGQLNSQTQELSFNML